MDRCRGCLNTRATSKTVRMKKELLMTEDGYEIYREAGVPQSALDLLLENSIGSAGLVYEHLNTPEHVSQLSNPTTISLQKSGRMLGIGIFCQVEVKVRQHAYNCYYVRYFSASQSIRGHGLMKKFGEKAMKLIRESENIPTIFYASIENMNISSFKVVSNSGYRTIRNISTIGLSRFFPKKSSKIKKAETGAEKASILDHLTAFYSGHSMVQFTKIFHQNDYYYLEENGEMVAGMQVHRINWRVKKMPGLSGKIILNVVPHVPLINRVFNPRKFDFLALEGIWFKPGHEQHFHQLLEGLLAENKLHTALWWMDESCPVLQQLKQYGQFGFIHPFTKNAGTHIMASTNKLSQEEIKMLEESPVYVSAFDFT